MLNSQPNTIDHPICVLVSKVICQPESWLDDDCEYCECVTLSFKLSTDISDTLFEPFCLQL